jgi:hypothetical protein
MRRSMMPFSPSNAPAADKQDVGGINLHVILLRVFAPALGRNVGDGAFQDLQQRLLHAFARYVARDAGRIGLAGDLINLVNVNDAALRVFDDRLDVFAVVGRLKQLEQDVFHVLAHVPRFGQRGRVGDGERNVQDLGKRLGKQRFAAAGRADQQNVAFLQFHLAHLGGVDALVVVVNGHAERLFSPLLPDHVLGQNTVDVARFGDRTDVQRSSGGAGVHGGVLAPNNVVTQVHAVQTNAAVDTQNEFFDLFAAFAAQHAPAVVSIVAADSRHDACACPL